MLNSLGSILPKPIGVQEGLLRWVFSQNDYKLNLASFNHEDIVGGLEGLGWVPMMVSTRIETFSPKYLTYNLNLNLPKS
jgi:hypothetical protein